MDTIFKILELNIVGDVMKQFRKWSNGIDVTVTFFSIGIDVTVTFF